MTEIKKTTKALTKPQIEAENKKLKAQLKAMEKEKVELEAKIQPEVSTDESDLVSQMREELEALRTQITNKPQVIEISNTNTIKGKKIKCISLSTNPVNISTEPHGRGRLKTFQKYGQMIPIRFDELEDMVSVYPNTMGSGIIFIADPEAVKELGLEDDYENIHSKETLDKVAFLREDMDVDIFIGLNDIMKKEMALNIAKNINKNEYIDANRLKKIKEETEIDIEEQARKIKDELEKAIGSM